MHGAGVVEVKTRDQVVDPDVLQKQLTPGSTPGSDAPESDAPGAPAGGPQADRQFPANLEEASS